MKMLYFQEDSQYVIMRRLVIEVSQKEYSKFEAEEGFEKVKTLEILHFLRYDQEEIAFICRIEFKDASARIEDVFQGRGHKDTADGSRKKRGKNLLR